MQNKQAFFGLIVAVAFLNIASLVLFYQKNTPVSYVSNLNLNPSPSSSESSSVDPTVTSWRTYTNDTYNMSLTVPDDWKEQDYAKQFPQGGTMIAFSPDSLPCDTCTYFHNGFFSLKIYNQKTNPEYYALYEEQVKKIGKDAQYQQVQVGGKAGVMSSNTLSIENDGWIYELDFDKDLGQAKISDSHLFQKIASSLTFTGLLFNK